MEIFTEFNHKSDLSLALGFFDGVHKGHQKVIKNAVNFAEKHNTKSAVITFTYSPACYFLSLKPKNIFSSEDKFKFIEKIGIDYIYLIDFKDIVNLSAEEYIKCLWENFSPKAITTGFNHTFGAKKSGTTELLKNLSDKFGYEYFTLKPEMSGEEIISSTLIRSLLLKGDVKSANLMLGQQFFVKGKVIHGEKLGRTLGFKTANITYPEDITDVKNGVYGVEVFVNHKKYIGVLNIGIRPTVSNTGEKMLEVNIFDFDKNIYGEEIKVVFIEKIRDEKKFVSVDELKNQISSDVQYWRNKIC